MLYDYFSTLLHEAANNQLSESQDEAILLISKFLVSREENEIMILKGYAGTGKTFLMAKLISVLTKLQQPTILLAPTGRAAKVLSTYANKQASPYTSTFTVRNLPLMTSEASP
jgi:exodeoxyribonuclease-5